MDSIKTAIKLEKKKHKKKKRKHAGDSDNESDFIGPSLSLASKSEFKTNNHHAKVFKPMSEEEWNHEQSKTRRVYDPDTGRNRLVKGSGEIIEEIVSLKQQHIINKTATKFDAQAYENTITKMTKKIDI